MIVNDLIAYDEKILLHQSFIPIINDSRKLVTYLTEITRQYHLLTPGDKQTVHDALRNNCEIENLCENNNGFTPVKYSQIIDRTFREYLKEFLTELWEGYHFVNSIRDNFGTVQEHFVAFKKHQSGFVCPFCGLLPLKPSTSIYRNAYDHYIPKALYPFISVNFNNLFPICHECNSDEKKTTDTLYRGNLRRQVFYPLDTNYNSDDLLINITPTQSFNPTNLKTLLDDINWDLTIMLGGVNDSRLLSWDEIFHIKRRYKENLSEYQKTWFEDFVLKRYKQDSDDGLSFNRFREKIIEESRTQIKDNPLSIVRFVYFNFLFSIPDFETRLNETIGITNPP